MWERSGSIVNKLILQDEPRDVVKETDNDLAHLTGSLFVFCFVFCELLHSLEHRD